MYSGATGAVFFPAELRTVISAIVAAAVTATTQVSVTKIFQLSGLVLR
jgi:hypothetical protein